MRRNIIVCLTALGTIAVAALALPRPSPTEDAPRVRKTVAGDLDPGVRAKKRDGASVEFFATPRVVHFEILVEGRELAALQRSPREYVHATVRADGEVYPDVGIHLKGAAGSFRSFHDKPALTLNFDKFVDKQKFHGMDKLHLNNSVQDSSYLSEIICGDLFRAADVPAPRVAHARVTLNGRDRGFYVLKEGFDRRFLKRYFEDTSGNLYDGGFLTDITAGLEKTSGRDPENRADLHALANAARQPDLERRRAGLEKLLDVERFITFVALEMITWHWDGYAMKRNNYRLYRDPPSGRFVFMPHGMDQMFGDARGSITPPHDSIVVRGVLGVPEWSKRYTERMAELLETTVSEGALVNRIAAVHRTIRPELEKLGVTVHHDQAVESLRSRVLRRVRKVRERLQREFADFPGFDAKGSARPARWYTRIDDGDARHDRGKRDGRPCLAVRAGERDDTVASWRSALRLRPGTYRFSARARASGVVALEDRKGSGAGVRISGTRTPRTNALIGDTDWSTIAHEFEVGEDDEVILVCELRATRGEVWFEEESLRIERVEGE